MAKISTNVIKIVRAPIDVIYNEFDPTTGKLVRHDPDVHEQIYNMPIYIKPETTVLQVRVGQKITKDMVEANIKGIKNNPYINRTEIESQPTTESAKIGLITVKLFYNDPKEEGGDGVAKYRVVKVPLVVENTPFVLEMYQGDDENGYIPQSTTKPIGYRQVVIDYLKSFDKNEAAFILDESSFVSFPSKDAPPYVNNYQTQKAVLRTTFKDNENNTQVTNLEIPVKIWKQEEVLYCLNLENRVSKENPIWKYPQSGTGETPFYPRANSSTTVTNWRWYNGELNLFDKQQNEVVASDGEPYQVNYHSTEIKTFYLEQKISDGTYERIRFVVSYNDNIAPVIDVPTQEQVVNRREMQEIIVPITENMANNLTSGDGNITIEGLPKGILYRIESETVEKGSKLKIILSGTPKDRLGRYTITVRAKDNTVTTTCELDPKQRTPINKNQARKTFVIRLNATSGFVNPMLRMKCP